MVERFVGGLGGVYEHSVIRAEKRGGGVAAIPIQSFPLGESLHD